MGPSMGGERIARFVSADLPPSINKLYTHFRGKTSLSAKGEKWKNRFITSRGGLSVWDIGSVTIDPSRELALEVWLMLPKGMVYTTSRGAKSRFKRRDVDNLIKIIQDAVFELLGIDDTAVFDVCIHKRAVEADDDFRIVMDLSYSELDTP